MDILAGHLLADRFARRIVAGPYIDDDPDETPNKEPGRGGGPFDPGSFNDDQAPPKPPPTKPTPRGIPPRPDVPMLMEPQSLQVQRQPLTPGEMPAEFLPGENGKPPAMPGMTPPPKMPGMMPPPQMPGMMRSPSIRPQKSPVRGPSNGPGQAKAPGELERKGRL